MPDDSAQGQACPAWGLRAARDVQAEIAAHLDISDRGVRELATAWGIDSRSISLDEWRLRYISHLRERAAGRAALGELDLATERARLAKEHADRVSMQNAATRRETAPIRIIEEVLASAGARAARLLDTVPGELRRRAPHLTADDLALVASIIAKARSIAASVSLADLDEDEDTEVSSKHQAVP